MVFPSNKWINIMSKKNTKKILIVKVGSDERPAGEQDIKDMKKKLKKLPNLKKV